MAAGGDDPGDRGRGRLTHCAETPVRGDPRPASFTPLNRHTTEVEMKVLFVSSELLMMFTPLSPTPYTSRSGLRFLTCGTLEKKT